MCAQVRASVRGCAGARPAEAPRGGGQGGGHGGYRKEVRHRASSAAAGTGQARNTRDSLSRGSRTFPLRV